MQSIDNVNPTIHLAIELSASSWLIAARLPGSEKPHLHRIDGGNIAALFALISSLRARVARRLDAAIGVICCFEDLAHLRTGDGREMPRHLRAELNRLRRRLVTILELIREVEAERDELVVTTPQDRTSRKIVALCRIRGLGENFAAVLTREVFYRSFGNRRQIASYVGITPMPYQSGGMDRDRRISRAGNPRARTTMIQLAWLWLRYQPGS